MGLLFNRKTSLDGKFQHSSNIFRKRIADKDINRWNIRDVSKELGFTHVGARTKFKEMLTKAQRGGLTREEVHGGLQDMIGQGYVTEKQAMRMAKELGLKRKSLRYFKDMSEMKRIAEKEENLNANAQRTSLREDNRHIPMQEMERSTLAKAEEEPPEDETSEIFDPNTQNPNQPLPKKGSIWEFLFGKNRG